VLEEFLATDIVVLGAPMYNFTIPSQLKALDRPHPWWRAKLKYSAQGVEGLAGNKRVIVAISRGRILTAPAHQAAVGEHLETYLRWVFGLQSVSRIPNSFPPTASRSVRSIAKRLWQMH